MLLSFVPMEAMASFYGNSVILPVVEEGEEAEPFGSDVSLLSLEGDATKYIYLYEGEDDCYSYGDIYLLQDGAHVTTKPEGEGVVQIMGGAGSVLAASSPVTCHVDDTGDCHIYYVNFSDLPKLATRSYLAATKTVNVTEGVNGCMEATIGMSATSLVSGELKTTEMTYDEILAAGIDVNDPDNQHVWKFATELTFTVGLKTYDLPAVAGYKNGASRFFNGSGGWYSFGGGGGGSGSSGGFNIGVFPMMREGFYLVTYGEAHWLKETYNVELLVMNGSHTDVIRSCAASLELPDGLSLAAMLDYAQSESIDIGTIAQGAQSETVWYVCGDKAGEYYLSASVTGVLASDNVSEPFAEAFTTDKPVKVYAGSALKLTVTADDMAEHGKDYHVKFHLENVSDKSLYNFSFGVTGVEQGKVLSLVQNDTVETVRLPIEQQDFEDEVTYKVDELAPGGYMEIEVSTTTWFNSSAEVGVAAAKLALKYATGTGLFGEFIDVAYYLDNVSVVTLEGSTTTIPTEINIKHVERENLIDKVIFGIANELYGDDLKEVNGSLGGKFVEVVGEEIGPESTLISAAKTILKLAKGETDYTFTVSIDDGKGTSNSIYNDYVSITTGTGTETVIDTLNGTKMTVEAGELSIQIKDPGNTKIKVAAEDSLGNLGNL